MVNSYIAPLIGVAVTTLSLYIEKDLKWMAVALILIFARGGLLYAFNLHPTWSQESVFINCRVTGAGGYRVIFSTDDWPYGGQTRINMDNVYYPADTEFGYGIKLYLPCRSGVTLKKVIW